MLKVLKQVDSIELHVLAEARTLRSAEFFRKL
jgi:hypothetical protein